MQRRTGNTTWLIKACLRDPNVVMVYGTYSSRDQGKNLFMELVIQQKKEDIIMDKDHKIIMPIFTVQADDKIYNGNYYSRPIVYDGSCF